MKVHRIFGIAICTGKKAELDKLDKLAAGTHHVHRNQKGGPRKKYPTAESFAKEIRGDSPDRNLDGSPYIAGASGEGQGGSHVSDEGERKFTADDIASTRERVE
jgi:hypothetical protein